MNEIFYGVNDTLKIINVYMHANPFTDYQEFNQILKPISYYGKPITNRVSIGFPHYQ